MKGSSSALLAGVFCALCICAPAPVQAGESPLPEDTFHVLVPAAGEYESRVDQSDFVPSFDRAGRLAPPVASLPYGGAFMQRLKEAYWSAYKPASVKYPPRLACVRDCGRAIIVRFPDGSGLSFHGNETAGHVGYMPGRRGESGGPGPGTLSGNDPAATVEDVRRFAVIVAAVRADPDMSEDQLAALTGNSAMPPVLYFAPDSVALKDELMPPPPPPPAPPPGLNARDIRYVSRAAPAYPGLALLEGHTGTVLIILDINADGVPLDVKVEKSSGFRELDRSAVDAARQWRFAFANPSTRIAKVQIPLHFSIPHMRRLAQGWPPAYSNPRYIRSGSPFPYDTVAGAFAAVSLEGHAAGGSTPAYTIECVPGKDGSAGECWAFLDMRSLKSIAVRYVFGGTSADPEVAVSALCEQGSETCDRLMQELLDGPVFAPSHATPE